MRSYAWQCIDCIFGKCCGKRKRAQAAAARQSSLRESRVGFWFAPPPAERGQICNSACRSAGLGHSSTATPHAHAYLSLLTRAGRAPSRCPSVRHGTGPPPTNIPIIHRFPRGSAAQPCFGARVSCEKRLRSSSSLRAESSVSSDDQCRCVALRATGSAADRPECSTMSCANWLVVAARQRVNCTRRQRPTVDATARTVVATMGQMCACVRACEGSLLR